MTEQSREQDGERRSIAELPVFAYGFRPFFLLAGLYGAFSILAWLVWLAGGSGPSSGPSFTPTVWHGHEMVFGYAAAVIGGFFLTAVPNWTGTAALRGAPLLWLSAIWLCGRLAMWASGALPAPLVAVVDLAFLPALAAACALPLWRARKTRNLIFLPILFLLWVANLLVHLEAMGVWEGVGRPGLILAIDAVVLLVVIVGGRIVPSFTGNALKARGSQVEVVSRSRVDKAAIVSVLCLLVAEIVAVDTATGVVALAAAVLNGLRMAGWRSLTTRGQPILWVLHLGYAWVVVGLACKAGAMLAGIPSESAALHALTVGAIGTMTLAVMSRAALGHTGRPLVVRPAVTVAYLLVSVSALARVAAAEVVPELYDEALLLAGLSWAAAFAIFSTVYWPILARPRADGKPG